MPERRRRPPARRLLAAAVVLSALFGAVVGASAIVGNGSPQDRAEIAATEGLVHDIHSVLSPEQDKAVIARDRALVRECLVTAFRESRAARCPGLRSRLAARLGITAPAAQAAAADEGTARLQAAVDDPAVGGSWAPAVDLPTVAIHSVMMPTGKILFFAYPNGSKTLNEAKAYVLDPNTGARTEIDPPIDPATGRPYNIWCAGQTLLPSGEVLVAGGNLAYGTGEGAGQSFRGQTVLLTFNPWTLSWTKQPSMRHGRWYPTLVTLPDGRVVIVSGLDETGNGTINPDVEVFTPAGQNQVGTLELKSSASRNIAYYPHMFVIPGGKVLLAGPRKQDSALLDTTSWTWQNLPQLPSARKAGTAVLMPSGPGGLTQMMMMGGIVDNVAPAQQTTQVINLANPTAGYTAGPPDVAGRLNANTVILPDGQLLTVGGGGAPTPTTYDNPVFGAEIYDPATGSWRAAAVEGDMRTYHSTALLMPNGKVFSGGDDRPGNYIEDTYELYSPPYLFKGARPRVSNAPDAVAYGSTFSVTSPDAARVTTAVLIKGGASTHAVDMSQRSIRLNMTPAAGGFTLTAPANATLATPGYYMLFLVDNTGVPSEARWVRLTTGSGTPPADPVPPVASFTISPERTTVGNPVTFTDTSTDADGTIASRAWDLDGDGQYDDATGATATWTYSSGPSAAVGLQVTDNSGLTATASGSVIIDHPATVTIPPGNLTTNPSFESNSLGWTGNNSVQSVTPLADAPNGRNVARVSPRIPGLVTYTLDDQPETVASTTAGTPYTATVYVKAATAATVGKETTLRLIEMTPTRQVVKQTVTPRVQLTNAFQKLTITATATASGNTMGGYTLLYGGDGTAFYADAYTITTPSASQSIPSPESAGWTRNGTATVNAGELELTPALGSKTGTSFWPTAISSSDITATFVAKIGGGTGADGMTFTLANPSAGATPASKGTGGGGLGYVGIPGVAITLDTAKGSGEPSASFVGIANGATGSLPLYVQTSNIAGLATSTHTVTVRVQSGTITVSIDGVQKLQATVTLPSQVLVGFTAATGGRNNRHAVGAGATIQYVP